MQSEDIALLFAGLITAVLNILPSIAGVSGLTPEQDAVILSAGAILKAVLGNIQTMPPQSQWYAISATNSTGGSFTSSIEIVEPDTVDAELARLTKLGFSNIKLTPEAAPA